MTLAILVALIAIFIVFVWSYPSNYAPNWRDFLVAFATSFGIMIFFYTSFPRYSLGRAGLIVLASITVSGFWAALLALAWVSKLSKSVRQKKPGSDQPIDVYSIPDSARQNVWRRDRGKCVRCGSEKQIQFVHVVPVSCGGTHHPDNLQLLCRNCSQFKRIQERIKPNSSTRANTSPVGGN